MPSEALTALFQEHVVASILKQDRLRDTLGEDFGWHVDDGDMLHVGHLTVPADVIGAELTATERFLWGWADPDAGPALAAEAVRRVGAERGIGELTSDAELPLAAMDVGVASLIATGVADLDGYFVAMNDEGAVSFAIRHDEVRERAAPLIHLAGSFVEVASVVPFSHRRAFAHYLARPLPDVPAATERGRAVLRGADATVSVAFDREGRAADFRFEAPA